MALAIPAGFGDTLAAGRPQTVQVIADGSDANSTNVALGYAANLVGGYAEELAAGPEGRDRMERLEGLEGSPRRCACGSTHGSRAATS